MKQIAYLFLLILIISCGNSDNSSQGKKTEPVDVTIKLPTESQQLLDKLDKTATQSNDSLFIDQLREMKHALSAFINDDKFLEANDLRIAVQNFLEQSPEVAKLTEKNQLLSAEVRAALNLPEIKEQTLTSLASVLNDAGVYVEEKTIRKIAEAQEEHEHNPLDLSEPREEVTTPAIEEEPVSQD